MKRLLILSAAACSSAAAGPFPPAAGSPGSDAIAAEDPRFVNWGASATVVRGPVDISEPESVLVRADPPENATGSANATPFPTAADPGSIVSLGDGGSATIVFDPPFADVEGPDFAVFENGFNANFIELAHVEVSSDGVNFFRFPSASLTPVDEQVDTFGTVDPTNVHNLAGKHPVGFGTPFDLAELAHHAPALDLERITHVRIIDVVGSIDPAFGSRDAEGRLINDPFPTPFPSGGFDLDAVGALSISPSTFGEWAAWHGLTGAEADPLAVVDGRTNLLRYALDGAVSATAEAVTFRRLAFRSDVVVRIEGSVDLDEWVPLASAAGAAGFSALAEGVIAEENAAGVRVTVPPGHPARFFRVAVELQSP